jgi:hypothetical protein
MLMLLALFFAAVQICPESIGDDFKLVTDVLDELGGSAESSNFKVRLSSGGQPSPPGVATSSNYQVRGGYGHSAAVLHGDVNADGVIVVGDMVYLQNYLYRYGPEPIPFEAGDLNCDGIIALGDMVYLQNYLYRQGPPPCDPPR